jgi:hypothetical protein
VEDTVENDKGNDGWTVIPLGVYRIVAFLPRPDEDQSQQTRGRVQTNAWRTGIWPWRLSGRIFSVPSYAGHGLTDRIA